MEMVEGLKGVRVISQGDKSDMEGAADWRKPARP